MEALTVRNNEKNFATLIHLSALTKYFIPFGNFILPIVLWGSKKGTSEFIDHNGKQAINFQLSMLTYSLILLIISVPSFIYGLVNNVNLDDNNNGREIIRNIAEGNLSNVIFIGVVAALIYGIMKVAEFFIIIYESIKANNGEQVQYPFTINYLK
ncbi:DUF4870 domain-containing protein [Flavobacterium amniphilum]|uniref:DUF4870 domain-containing protein n=1 Tax=Flavobacterium amniphilum TaxID=1834035 RepID=UPI002029E301|nr:DUF4870 domain-containing protein [Flavobacterium amniphilum]MCL9805004.1 DUF4870 domain-containing protein [Flavobacterium amniphilum]